MKSVQDRMTEDLKSVQEKVEAAKDSMEEEIKKDIIFAQEKVECVQNLMKKEPKNDFVARQGGIQKEITEDTRFIQDKDDKIQEQLEKKIDFVKQKISKIVQEKVFQSKIRYRL